MGSADLCYALTRRRQMNTSTKDEIKALFMK